MTIELQHTNFRYPDTESGILKDIDLKIEQGECVLLTGASGCGKTTLFRIMNGLIPSVYNGEFDGKALLDSKEIKDMPSWERASHIGCVFQNPRTQFFNVDTDSEIAFGLENAGVDTHRINEAIDNTVSELRIEKLKNRDIFKLSGGEKQKIAFASVFAMDPDIYMLDEPSANLDKEGIEELKKCLAKVKEMGKTIVIAEHRLYYLTDIVDRVIYLKDGCIDRIFTNDEFRGLTDDELAGMGLRSTREKSIVSVKERCNDKKLEAGALRLTGLNIYRGGRKVIEDFNVSFERGKIYGIVGRNGAGKTTLVRTVAGLNRNYDGSISCEGKVLKPSELKSKAYMVMQDVNYQLFADSVWNECTLGIKKPDEEKTKEALRKMDLLKYSEKHPNVLSGGQKQRLAIIVSELINKDILLFDEPTSGLDYNNMLLTAELLKTLKDKGRIVIVVTHDEELISCCCDEIIRVEANGDLPENITVG